MRNQSGKNFVTLMLIIVGFALLLKFAVNQTINVNIEQNEPNASVTLKSISAALENYARDNKGVFPTSFSVLNQPHPTYLSTDYLSNSPIKGYNYSCSRLEPSGYKCFAVPVICKITGTKIYTVTTGGTFVEEECTKAE